MGLFDKLDKIVDSTRGIADNAKVEFLKSTINSMLSSKQHQRAQVDFNKLVDEYTKNTTDYVENYEAILYAQAYEKQWLKNPASASFPPIDEFVVYQEGEVFIVTGYVDATNSYGAQVRGNMERCVTKFKGTWISITRGSIQNYNKNHANI